MAFEIARFQLPGNSLVPELQSQAERWLQLMGADITRINELQRDTDKTWDLGWVYTIIAGVLNVLVIYDALAGPAFRQAKAAPPQGTPPT